MQSTVPLNATINKKLKQGAEDILRENGISPEEALTFLYRNIVARNFDLVGMNLPKQNNT